jgi:AraC-like DNA-binding protein
VSTGILAIQTEIGAWVASPDRAAWIPAGTWHEHRVYGNSSVHLIGFPMRDAPLADTSPTVTEAAHRCGWATSSAFVDSFAHTMGQTPGTYRAAASPRVD